MAITLQTFRLAAITNRKVSEVSKQSQKSGDASTNIQIINQGLSMQDVKEICFSLFRENFLVMKDESRLVTEERVKEITELALVNIQEKNPEGLQQAKDPDFQYTFFEAQKAYARSGKTELRDLLSDLLVERSKCSERNMTQLVISESVQVVAKLHEEHLAALSAIFVMKHTQNNAIRNLEELMYITERDILGYAHLIPANDFNYRHLVYANCGTIAMGSVSIENIFLNKYTGLFLKGKTEEEIESFGISLSKHSQLFMPSLNDKNKLQTKFLNTAQLKQQLANVENSDKILNFNNSCRMRDTEVKELCIKNFPKIQPLFDVWDKSLIKRIDLSSVGISLGHANLNRLAGDASDLDKWVND